MRVEMTVAMADREQDVRIEAPDDAALAAVLPALAGAVGAAADTSVWVGNDLLSPTTPLADHRLRTGARLLFGTAGRPSDRSPVLALHVAGGPAAGLVVPLERGRLTIGRAADNDLVLPDGDVSRRHAVLTVTATGLALHDVGSANGTVLAGSPLPADGARLRPGDIVRVGASLLVVAGPAGRPASSRPGPDGSILFDRTPRIRESASDRVITMPSGTSQPRPRRIQWVSALLPAAAGIAIAWLLGQPEFLLFALLSPVMVISASLGDRLHWRRSRRRSAADLRRQCEETEREIAAALASESARRRRAAPDAAEVYRAVCLPDTRVWARRRGDADLLRVRLGLADLPSTLIVREGTSAGPAGTVADVPACVDLQCGAVGLAGPPDAVQAAARWLMGQLATHTAPADVEFALLLGPDREVVWRWMRWLPHVRAKVAVTADDCTALVAAISAVIEQRAALQRSGEAAWDGGWLVVLVDRPAAGGLAGLADLLTRGPDVGVTGVWLTASAASLPACCASTARVVGLGGSRIVVRNPDGVECAAVLDEVSIAWADEVARRLAPLVDGGAAGTAGFPDACHLLDVVGLEHVDEAAIRGRWCSSTGGATAVLGMGTSGPVTVDLAADGPHALIAGTTGAGKSELLRTLVAGLAVAHPPDELNLLLVDYKGGAAFADCAHLPHVAGLVTDLDPHLTERALRSLRAELRRRERLFAATGADDLADYRRRNENQPIPRLVIVVDEFATLAEELPGFVSGLVNVARLGRSLGVHLVLATQRPGGAVSPDIRANTELRIALRVADPSESRDVIGSPLAASIERRLAGRGYLRTGSALVGFQTAYVSSCSVRDSAVPGVQVLDEWRRPPQPGMQAGETDLARLVAALTAAARERGSPAPHPPWPPPLPKELRRCELGRAAHRHAVALGRIDRPDEQRQETLEFDLAAQGSLLVVGAIRSGRTSTLVSLALGAASSLSPAELHIHLVDPSGNLAHTLRPLPHCGTVLGPAELSLVPTLLARIERGAAQRLVDGDGAGTSRPTVLLLVDGWDLVCAGLGDSEAAAGTETLVSLLRAAVPAGFAIAVSGDRGLLAPRFSAGFAERLLLRLPDRVDVAAVGVRTHDLSATLPPGRAIRAVDGTLVQLALPAAAGDAVRDEIATTALRWPSAPPATSAIRVRPLPALVRLAELPAEPGRLTLGLAGDDPAPVLVDPFAGPGRWLVAGPPRSGRSTLLQLLAVQAHASGIATLVAASERSRLFVGARSSGIPAVGPGGAIPHTPERPTLVLVDDSEAFTDTGVGTRLAEWARRRDLPVAVVAAGRADDLATSYRGVAAEVRRHRFGVLLRPGPLDGELFGLRLARRAGSGPPGRGVALADPSWGAAFGDGGPVPIQVALP